jgi:tripartite-type tricarboxylate transporter receptor subunit TctC
MAKLQRRQFVRLVAGVAALPAMSRSALADDYPAQPVKLVVAYPAGNRSPPDVVGHLVAQVLSERIGQKVLIDNRPGAGGNTGTESVVKAPADGYTLLLITVANTTNPPLYRNLGFNITTEIAPIAGFCRGPFVMTASPSLSAESVAELIAAAKASPGQIKMASGGTGSGPHLAGELFQSMAAIKLLHVPYESAEPALDDLMAGKVQVMFIPAAAAMKYIRTKQLRALAVTTASRLQSLPQIPSVGEFVHGYEAATFYGLGAPKGTPGAIVEKLNSQIIAALADPAIKPRLADLGAVPMPMTPAEFAKLISDEIEKWTNVVKFAGIQPK